MLKMETKQVQLLCMNLTDAVLGTKVLKDIFKDYVPVDLELSEKTKTNFKWKLDNKYFTAEILTCFCSDSDHINQLTNIEAVLLICNANDKSCIENLKNTISFVKQKDPEICLLYSIEKVNNSSRDEIFEFCIENHFEFVECHCKDEDEEDDGEKYGVERILEALNSHVWSGHVMKCENNCQKNLSVQNIDDGFSEIPTGDESFEELFSKFLSMKEKAKTLGDEERRSYAEKVSLAFMEALGIEEEEEEENGS